MVINHFDQSAHAVPLSCGLEVSFVGVSINVLGQHMAGSRHTAQYFPQQIAARGVVLFKQFFRALDTLTRCVTGRQRQFHALIIRKSGGRCFTQYFEKCHGIPVDVAETVKAGTIPAG